MKNAKQTKLGLIISAMLVVQVVYAIPQGAQVVQGSVSISMPNSTTMNITNSNNAVINWQQFNIGAGQTTNFIQPNSSSSVLNRVISNNPSQILGNLNSNGQVFLINQHGILVGEGARINTNGFFASTLNITNKNFLNGNLSFSEGGLGDINNKGYIHAGEDGNVVLIAPNIENGGVIDVDNGNIILAAGESITITSLDNSSVEFHVQATNNKVTNLGSVIAKNGAASLFAGTLKHTGLIRASGLVRDENGIIRLVALDKNTISGEVDVSGEHGGNIEILGDVVDVQSGSIVNASGQNGGGSILIGGDQQGLNPTITNATSTTVETGALISADATQTGDGGKVIVFASNDVHVHEVITAKGGSESGDGGFIETSGLQQLDITAVPDASASEGNSGEWLIDPNNITIGNSGTNTNISQNGGDFTSTGDAAFLDVSLIVNALDAGIDVTITTGSSGANSDVGNLNVVRDIILTSQSTVGNLTLNAHNNININANIGSSSFGSFDLTLNANTAGNTGVVNFNNSIINLGGGNLTLTGNSVAISNAVSFAGRGGQINLSAPLIINSSATLTLSANFAAGQGDTTVNNNNGITNNGTLLIQGGCGDGCGAVVVNGVVENNGVIDITGGQLDIAGTLNLNSGSSIIANLIASQFGPGEGHLNIASNGTLNVNVATVLPTLLNFDITAGTINDFHNLTLPTFTNFTGGTVNFNQDILGLYQPVNGQMPSIIINDGSVLTFNGVDQQGQGHSFLYTGNIDWQTSAPQGTNNLILNNTDLRLMSDFQLSGSQSVTINGTNGQLSLLGGSFLNNQLSAPLIINTPIISNGRIHLNNTAQLNVSNGLTLGNGGLISGSGMVNANINVAAGGVIAPGGAGYNSTVGTLNVTGNVTFEAGSILMVDVDPGVSTSSTDVLNVTGSVALNGGDAYFLWDNLQANQTSTPQVLGGPLNIISATSNITGSGLTLSNLIAYIGGSLGAVGSNYQYTAGSLIPNQTIHFWTGIGNTNNWSDAGNWFTGVVPVNGNNVVVESSTLINVDLITNQLASTQIDAPLNINANSSLNVNTDDLLTLNKINVTDATATLSGSGSWLNFGAAYFDKSGFTLAKDVINYGYLQFTDTTTSTNNFNVTSSTFVNNGSFLAYTQNVNVDIDFSGSSSGFINKGDAQFIINGGQTSFLGGFNNNSSGSVGFLSPQNTQTKVIFNNAITNTGVFNLTDTILEFSNGAIFNLSTTGIINGQGGLVVNNGAQFLVQTNGTTLLAANQNLTLNGGTVSLNGTGNGTNGLTILGVMDWNAGIVNGLAGNTLIASSGSTINMAAGFGTNILDNVNMSIVGTLDLVSNNAAFPVNENRFTVMSSNSVSGGNTLNLLSAATLTGGGLIYVDQTSNINFSDALQINPKILLAGTANFAGSAGLAYLGLENGSNATVNLNVNGASTAGNTLNVQNLSWLSGSINGNASSATNLVTTGVSTLTSGSLINVDWINQGQLDWTGSNLAILTLNNSTLTNATTGVINVNGSQTAFAFNNQQGQAEKSILGGTGSFVNNGTINLINADLDISGMTLIMGNNLSVLNGNGTITGDVVNSNGSITIGNPAALTIPGGLTINGNYSQGANGSLQIRVVDPINGQFSYDTFTVNGTANLDGELKIAYFTNKVVSITESFNPFSFSNRNGMFSSLVDSNGNILGVDLSNGGFKIIGSSTTVNTPIQEIIQSQEEFEKLLEALKDEGLDKSLAFINEILDENDDNKKAKKKNGPKLVCR